MRTFTKKYPSNNTAANQLASFVRIRQPTTAALTRIRPPTTPARKYLLALLTLSLLLLLYDQTRFYLYSTCRFDTSPSATIPVILMAMGRSGSSVTWDTLSKLTSRTHEPNIAYEVTGQTAEKAGAFFRGIRWQLGSRWAVLRLCSIQKKWPMDGGIIGFQWKPYKVTLSHKYGIGAFRNLGDQQPTSPGTQPPIRVVLLIRNPLDRRTSNTRHNANSHISAHCTVDDHECIEKHRDTARGGVTIPTGAELLSWLGTDVNTVNRVRTALGLNGVRYIEVSYEKLYRGEDAEEWMRIFRFLGRGPGEGLSMADVRDTFSMAATTVVGRNETIANFGEVEECLRNSRYKHLLYE